MTSKPLTLSDFTKVAKFDYLRPKTLTITTVKPCMWGKERVFELYHDDRRVCVISTCPIHAILVVREEPT